MNRAGRAVAASNIPVLGRHAQEVLPAQAELAVAVRVHDETHHIGDRQAFGALALALAARAAEVRPDFFQPGRQTLASASLNRSDITLKFCSSWSISVMLGTVVAMAGFWIAHFSAAGANVAGRCGCGAPRRPALAITFMAITPTPACFSFSIAGP